MFGGVYSAMCGNIQAKKAAERQRGAILQHRQSIHDTVAKDDEIKRQIEAGEGDWIARDKMHPHTNISDRYFRTESGCIAKWSCFYPAKTYASITDWFFPAPFEMKYGRVVVMSETNIPAVRKS